MKRLTIQTLTTSEVHIHLYDAIEEFEDYTDFADKLNELTSEDTVYLHLNTGGGDCAVGAFIAERIMAAACPVNVIVEYPTFSMGAVLAMCGDSLTLLPGTYLMFHDYSETYRGRGNEASKYFANDRKAFQSRFKHLCCPFLTEEEVTDMFNGQDLYIHADDEDLTDRINRHYA